MTDTLTALLTFLKPYQLPVYLHGQVPDGAAYPYAVLNAATAPFGQRAICEMTGWFRGPEANARCAAWASQLVSALPESGVLLRLPHGVLTLHPASPLTRPVTDRDAIGIQVRIELRRYEGGK